MRDDGWKTLFHPFEAGHLDLPQAGSRTLFLGAEPGLRLPEGFLGRLTLVQGFRPSFLQLRQSGLDVLPEVEGEGYDLALVLAGRHRGRNEAWIGQAAARVREGGLVVVAASKQNGGDSLRRRMAKLVTLDSHLSKHHGIVFWLRRGGDWEKVAAALRAGFDIRHALIGFGADSSHGWERTHLSSLTSIAELLTLYAQNGPVVARDQRMLGPLEGFPHQVDIDELSAPPQALPDPKEFL